ncbi:hypothetical protein GCM10022245_12680 [Streptomyces mayteni]
MTVPLSGTSTSRWSSSLAVRLGMIATPMPPRIMMSSVPMSRTRWAGRWGHLPGSASQPPPDSVRGDPHGWGRVVVQIGQLDPGLAGQRVVAAEQRLERVAGHRHAGRRLPADQDGEFDDAGPQPLLDLVVVALQQDHPHPGEVLLPAGEERGQHAEAGRGGGGQPHRAGRLPVAAGGQRAERGVRLHGAPGVGQDPLAERLHRHLRDPALSIALGTLFLAEPLTWRTAAGGLLVLSGVLLTRARPAAQVPRPAPQ